MSANTEQRRFNFGHTHKTSDLSSFIARFIALPFLVFSSACATRGHDMTRYLIEGNDAAVRGDFANAVTRYDSALQEVPSSPIVKRNLGIVLVKVGNYKRARSLLESILPRYEKDVEVRYYLGEAARGVSDYSSALTHYQKALTLDARDLRSLKAYAWTYNKIGNPERTLAIVEPMLARHPSDVQLRLIAATAYNRTKKYKEASSALAIVEKSGFKLQSRDRVSADAERVLVLSTLGEAYVGLEKCDKATSMYNEILKTRPLLSNALTGLAKCDLKDNRTDKAVAKLEKAAKADPEMPEAHYLLAKILEKSDSKKSAFYYRRFLILARDNSEFRNETEISKNALNTIEKENSANIKKRQR